MKTNNKIVSVDAVMDERFGKVGTPEREAFRKEAYNYCVGKFISEARKREKKCWVRLDSFSTYHSH